jgi:hypothetical protein
MDHRDNSIESNLNYLDALEELVAGHAGHPVVGDDHVDVGDEAEAEELERPRRRLHRGHPVLGAPEDLGDDGAVHGAVVHRQHVHLALRLVAGRRRLRLRLPSATSPPPPSPPPEPAPLPPLINSKSNPIIQSKNPRAIE